MTSSFEQQHPRARTGKFTHTVKDAPQGKLTATPERTPTEMAFDLINTPAPDGLTESQLAGYDSVAQTFAANPGLTQQPVSYIAYQAQRNYELAAHRRYQPYTPEMQEMWQARIDRLDEVSEELHRLADTARYPNRAPENTGTDPRPPLDVIRDTYADPRVDRHPTPRGLTETRRAVNGRKGEPEGKVRAVELNWDSVPATSNGAPLAVHGPADGRPIIVDVTAGCPTMEVVSGHAIIIVNGSGFGITVQAGAEATIIAGPDQKVSTTTHSGGVTNLHFDERTRGYQHIHPGANVRLHGQAHHVTLNTDRRGYQPPTVAAHV